MTLNSDLFAAITGTPGVSSIIGTRMYPETLPQSATLPALTYQRVTMPFEQPMNGHSIAARWPRFQFDAWAATGDAARALREQLIAALLAFAGVYGVTLEGGFDDYEANTSRHRASIDAVIGHSGA